MESFWQSMSMLSSCCPARGKSISLSSQWQHYKGIAQSSRPPDPSPGRRRSRPASCGHWSSTACRSSKWSRDCLPARNHLQDYNRTMAAGLGDVTQTLPGLMKGAVSAPRLCHMAGALVAARSARGEVAAGAGSGSLMDVFQAMQAQMQGMAAADEPPLADVDVSDLTFHPAGTEEPLLRNISFRVPARKLGLIYGRSGAGKTTLLQLVAGLTAPTSGSICITETTGLGAKHSMTSPTDRLSRTGLVFQFPERHFLASTLQQELVFGWPTDAASLQVLSSRVAIALPALGLSHIPLETPLRQLSDGYKRRCALAVALVRRPSVLLLDEPLAGLDWKSRADIASVLGKLKEECTVIVVSHDLREIASLVDMAWEMQPNGTLSPQKEGRLLQSTTA